MDEEDDEDDDDMLASSASVSRGVQSTGSSLDDDLEFEDLDGDIEEEEESRGGGRAAAGGAAAGAAAVMAARKMAEQKAAAQAREQAKKAAAAAAMDARRKAAVEAAKRAAKAKAAAEAARKAAEMEAAAAAAAAAKLAEPAAEFDPNEFNFGGSAEDISFGSASSMIEVDEAEEESSYGSSSGGYVDLDEPTPTRSRTPTRDTRSRAASPRTRSTSSASSGGIDVTGRLGYGRFQYLSFMTYGFEASYQLQDNIAVVGGLEAFSTRRLLPPEQVPVGQPAVQWNTIVPLSVGALYRPMNDTIRPYVGANIQLLPGYVAEAGAVAFGLQARGGFDYLLADNLGINVNAGAGFWAGSEWYRIDGLLNTGMTAQINVGTVFLF